MLYDIRPFSILMWYVSDPFLQFVTLVAFSKFFGAFIITIFGFKLKILRKKNNIGFPKKEETSKKFILSNYVKMSYGLGKLLE